MLNKILFKKVANIFWKNSERWCQKFSGMSQLSEEQRTHRAEWSASRRENKTAEQRARDSELSAQRYARRRHAATPSQSRYALQHVTQEISASGQANIGKVENTTEEQVHDTEASGIKSQVEEIYSSDQTQNR